MPDTTDRSLWRRGVATLRRFIVAHPVPFSTSVAGSSVYALTSVIGTVVLGRVTDRMITPRSTVTSRARRLGRRDRDRRGRVLRSAGVITRRYFAGKTTWRPQARLRNQIADHYLEVPLAFHRGTRPASCSPTPTST